jgi:hypothetical protein
VDSRVTYTDKHIFFRSAGEINPTIERAEGIYCYDSDGKRYIDGMGALESSPLVMASQRSSMQRWRRCRRAALHILFTGRTRLTCG